MSAQQANRWNSNGSGNGNGSGNVARPLAPAESAITVKFVLSSLRRWWTVAAPIGLLLAAVGAAVVYLTFRPVYEAAAWFKIESRTPYLAFENKDEDRSKLFFETQIEMIRSPLVLGPVIKRPEIARLPKLAEQPDKVAWLAKQIRVVSVGQSELFRILYADPDATDASHLVNAVTESYFQLCDQSESERNQRIIELLTEQQSKRSTEVMRLRNNLRDLAKATSGSAAPVLRGASEAESPRPMPSADLEGRLIAAQVERTVLEARIKAAEEAFDAKKQTDTTASEGSGLSPQERVYCDGIIDKVVEDSMDVQQQEAIISQKRARLNEILDVSAKGKKAPAYVKLADEIGRDEQRLDQLRKDLRPRARREAELSILAKRGEMRNNRSEQQSEYLARMRSDRQACRMLEQALQTRCEQQRKEAEKSSGNVMELEFKRDELARAEKVFELIAQRTLQLETERAAPARITLMQAATPPPIPVETFPYRNIALAILTSLCAPFALAVLWERMVGRVADTQTLERQASLTLLGEIVQLSMHTRISDDSGSRRVRRDRRLFEESIDSLRTNLTLSDSLTDLRMLAVTSAASSEGKTSVAAQLALSFSRATGKPLLLIDGDMRSPDIHRLFGVPLEPGLANVLAAECTLSEAIVETSNPLVHLLPAGRLGASPHTLLGNGAWKSLLAEIPDSYRYILIDTPPVLAASEAMVLARAADASLVCVMRNVSRMDQVRKSVDRLLASGGRPIGLVLSGVPMKDYSYRWGDYDYTHNVGPES